VSASHAAAGLDYEAEFRSRDEGKSNQQIEGPKEPPNQNSDDKPDANGE